MPVAVLQMGLGRMEACLSSEHPFPDPAKKDPHQAAPQLAAQWARIRGRLQNEVGDVEYRTWLRQMTLAGLEGDEITLRMPSRFLRDWVRSHYGDRLTALWKEENSHVRRVEIRVGPAVQTTPHASSHSGANAQAHDSPSSQASSDQGGHCDAAPEADQHVAFNGVTGEPTPLPDWLNRSVRHLNRRIACRVAGVHPRRVAKRARWMRGSRSTVSWSVNPTSSRMPVRAAWLSSRRARASIPCSCMVASGSARHI
jgi:hypothetical protein